MRNPYIIFFALVVLVLSWVVSVSGGGGVFQVNHKFGRRIDWSLTDLKLHDTKRHGSGRLLAEIYYTKLAIGSPPRDFFLVVDTGSDVFWVNCAKCGPCHPTYTLATLMHPMLSFLQPTLNLYDPKFSSTSSVVPCGDDFCTEYSKGRHQSGCSSNKVCRYSVGYADGSTTAGYFVHDTIGFDKISANFQATIGTAEVSFGCGMKVTGKFGNPSLDGLIGFGASSTSLLSQLASEGKVSKKFAHCLDGRNGGGIFVIGDVVQPPLTMTPLVANAQHYNVNMKSIQVGNNIIDISKFQAGDGERTIVDSGTSLTYFPKSVLDPLKQTILASQPNLTTYLLGDFYECFGFNKSIDDSLPTVTFRFKNSLQLNVYPHDYLFTQNEGYCFGWQDGAKFKTDLIILGDLVLNNKLVLYDLENQALGVSEYDCSSTIGLKDEESGSIYQVGGSNTLSSYPTRYHKDISSSPAQHFGRVIQFILLSFMLYSCV
ncbi:hypothetical protein MKW98_025227 [Papaver atlanticum]|uniref:Peptidase A1 domain-containing protein n=1 Tax=Papaver atlanticum TaxID=357466 RepID=A0AAD4S1S3_9MAGN|nr:hypothetical protein MKW98_025227 [Papaver atlanticum]